MCLDFGKLEGAGKAAVFSISDDALRALARLSESFGVP